MSFGNTTIGGATELQNSSMVTPRLVSGNDYTPATSEFLAQARVYARNAGGGNAFFKVGIYNVTGGDTTASKVGEWIITIPVQAAGWATVTIPNVPLTAGQTYNYSFCDSDTNTVTYFVYRQTTTNKSQSGSAANRLLPATWGANGGASTVDPLIEFITTTGQVITAFNNGNAVTVGQTNIPVTATGFSGVPTTIITDIPGLVCSNITGTASSFSFQVNERSDGAIYPINGTSVTFTISRGTETVNVVRVINHKSTETIAVIASPIINNTRYIGGALLAQHNRTLLDGDVLYYTVPPTMSDLIVYSDGRITSTNAGSFNAWLYIASGVDAGKNYSITFNVTLAASVTINITGIFSQSESPKYDGLHYTSDRP